jgi:histidine triad (HIT) family protein
MEDCIFCKIVSGESPASIVFEDDVSMVIEPIDPISKGHVLIIPKKHSVNMLDAYNEVLTHLIIVTKNVGKDLLRKHNAEAMNFLHAAGKEAQQSVFHMHFHLVPRYKNDGLDRWLRNKL